MARMTYEHFIKWVIGMADRDNLTVETQETERHFIAEFSDGTLLIANPETCGVRVRFGKGSD